MADIGEEERKEKKRNFDLGAAKDQGSPIALGSPKNIQSQILWSKYFCISQFLHLVMVH
jgi:hypothetical protein